MDKRILWPKFSTSSYCHVHVVYFSYKIWLNSYLIIVEVDKFLFIIIKDYFKKKKTNFITFGSIIN